MTDCYAFKTQITNNIVEVLSDFGIIVHQLNLMEVREVSVVLEVRLMRPDKFGQVRTKLLFFAC